MLGAFAQVGVDYARRGCAVIPCGGADGKEPLMKWRGMRKVPGAHMVEALAGQFPSANIGLITGLSGITVVDLDSSDSSLFENMEERCGVSPLVARTPRGGAHLFFKSAGERTTTKVDGLPVDVRGVGGFVVAAPSVRPHGAAYQIVRGSIDDLSRLPHARPGSLPLVGAKAANCRIDPKVAEGSRNRTLWHRLMVEARSSSTVDELLAKAEILNESINNPPLPHEEVVRAVRSAWKYQIEGRNWAGGGGRVFLEVSQIERFAANPDAALLLLKLRGVHGLSDQPFAVSPKAMSAAKVMPGWSVKRFRSARNFLLDAGDLLEIHKGGRGTRDPSQFKLAAAISDEGLDMGLPRSAKTRLEAQEPEKSVDRIVGRIGTLRGGSA